MLLPDRRSWLVALAVLLMLPALIITSQLFAAASLRQSLPLTLPVAAELSSLNYEPVPYTEYVAGEFLDVDLPDELKQEKYGEPAVSESRYTLKLAVYSDPEQAQMALQLLQEKDSQIVIREVSDTAGRLTYQLHLGQYRYPAQANHALLDLGEQYMDGVTILKY